MSPSLPIAFATSDSFWTTWRKFKEPLEQLARMRFLVADKWRRFLTACKRILLAKLRKVKGHGECEPLTLAQEAEQHLKRDEIVERVWAELRPRAEKRARCARMNWTALEPECLVLLYHKYDHKQKPFEAGGIGREGCVSGYSTRYLVQEALRKVRGRKRRKYDLSLSEHADRVSTCAAKAPVNKAATLRFFYKVTDPAVSEADDRVVFAFEKIREFKENSSDETVVNQNADLAGVDREALRKYMLETPDTEAGRAKHRQALSRARRRIKKACSILALILALTLPLVMAGLSRVRPVELSSTYPSSSAGSTMVQDALASSIRSVQIGSVASDVELRRAELRVAVAAGIAPLDSEPFGLRYFWLEPIRPSDEGSRVESIQTLRDLQLQVASLLGRTFTEERCARLQLWTTELNDPTTVVLVTGCHVIRTTGPSSIVIPTAKSLHLEFAVQSGNVRFAELALSRGEPTIEAQIEFLCALHARTLVSKLEPRFESSSQTLVCRTPGTVIDYDPIIVRLATAQTRISRPSVWSSQMSAPSLEATLASHPITRSSGMSTNDAFDSTIVVQLGALDAPTSDLTLQSPPTRVPPLLSTWLDPPTAVKSGVFSDDPFGCPLRLDAVSAAARELPTRGHSQTNPNNH